MQQVHTPYGPGQVIDSQTVRGRTEYRVAGNDFNVWVDETKVAAYEPDPTMSGEHWDGFRDLEEGRPRPGWHNNPDGGWSEPSWQHERHHDVPGSAYNDYVNQRYEGSRHAFAPVDEDNSVDLPYDPAPQYGVGPQTESTIQPIHEIDADERTSPANSVTFEDRSRDEGDEGGEPGPNPDLFAKESAYFPEREPGHDEETYPGEFGDVHRDHGDDGLDETGMQLRDYGPDEQSHWENDPDYQALYGFDGGRAGEIFNNSPHSFGRGVDEASQDAHHFGYHTADVLETGGDQTPFEPDFIVNDTDDEHLRVDVEEDERETTDPEGIVHFASHHQANPLAIAAPAIARGLAGGAAGAVLDENANAGSLPTAGPKEQIEGVGENIEKFDKDGNPLPLPDLGHGWGSLTQKKGYRPAGLDDRYADIVAAYDPYDKVAQFRHDPEAYINRVGHAEYEGLNPRMAQYMDLVEGDEMIRTGAWKDVRQKAMRLRREGKVHVKDVGDDRIYASVEGDHGTYDVMIKKGGSFGGFGGGHSITNWHCACEWGKWAFKRQYSYVGRLCSHGYASYLELQSAHLKGVKRPSTSVRYPKRRTSAVHTADDQTTQDWKIDDTADAKGALDDLREWAEQPHDTWNQHHEEHNEDVRDAVDKAHEEGVDASQLVASLLRQAAPDDDNQEDNWLGRQNIPFTNMQFGDLGGNTPPPAAAADNADHSGAGNLIGGPSGVSGGQTPPSGAAQVQQNVLGPAGADLETNSSAVEPGVTDAGTGSSSAYTVQPGDTLSGIAETHGGGDYNAITNQGGGEIGNKDLINPGQQLDLSALPGGGDTTGGANIGTALGGTPTTSTTGGEGGLGSSLGGGSDSSSSSSSDSSKGWFGKDSTRRQADHDPNHFDPNDPALANPALNNPAAPAQPGQPVPPVPGQPAANPAGGTDSPNPAAPQADTSAIAPAGGTDDLGGFPDATDPAEEEEGLGPTETDVGTGEISPASSGSTDSASGDPMGGFDMGGVTDMISQGVGAATDIASGIGDAVSSFAGILGSSKDLQADPDWQMAAYGRVAKELPYGTTYPNHKPFNGSGGFNITEWGQSKDNVKENYSDNLEDPTEVPKKTFLEDLGSVEDERIARRSGGGIRRAGTGPQRAPVTPEVIRERKPRRPVEASVEAHLDDNFDPLAPRTAASFDAADGRDIVAQFQANIGETALGNGAGGGGAYDDFSNSPAFRQAMQRTAGRNYSLAEQAALVREGDIGGAGNLDQLDLTNTHYEAMNSVGLW